MSGAVAPAVIPVAGASFVRPLGNGVGIRVYGSSSGYVGLKGASSAGSVDYTLPAADGTDGQVLKTNGSAVLSWTTVSGGTPAGSSGQIQFNSSGSFGADSALVWDSTDKAIDITMPNNNVERGVRIALSGAGGDGLAGITLTNEAGTTGLIDIYGANFFGISSLASKLALGSSAGVIVYSDSAGTSGGSNSVDISPGGYANILFRFMPSGRMGIGGSTSPADKIVVYGADNTTGATSGNIRFSYSGDPTNYTNCIQNLFAGTPASHCMQFSITSIGSEVIPLKLTADNKVHVQGTPVFGTSVGIDNNAATPMAKLEISDADISDGEFLAFSYKTDRTYFHKVLSNVVGAEAKSCRLRFSINAGNANTNVTALDVRGDASILVHGAIRAKELAADPADPPEGECAIWMSDGTGTGDDGDLLVKITAGGVTKTATLVDFSAV